MFVVLFLAIILGAILIKFGVLSALTILILIAGAALLMQWRLVSYRSESSGNIC